ncbi:putative DNA polymerase protein, partial [Naja naja]
MLKNNEGLKRFLAGRKLPTPLNPRDAFFGGRTNATCLYYKPKQGEQILYYDFTSLYPFVNKNKAYPIGHPEIIYQNFGDIKQYFGFAKVKVYPPRGLYFPVLPHKSGEKLMFSLCATCTEKQQVTVCHHNDEERALTGTWCTVELSVAVEKGYRIAEIYEVWHFERKTKSLFSDYINMHLRQKQEASGYPDWCKTEEDKERYVRDYKKNEGVQLRREHIEYNPAKRQIAKLFLNSLWGKFGQSTNHLTTTVVTEPEELFMYLFVPYYEVSSCEFVDEAAVLTFTTAYARLELYSLLEHLGDRCLYHDTDSVIFISREGAWSPSLGDYLGQLTSEIPPNTSITEFAAAGPKTYGYALSNGSTVLKVKGITLNSANSVKVNFESLKDLVNEYCLTGGVEKKEIKVQQQGIVRIKKRWALETRVLRKTLKVVYNKR